MESPHIAVISFPGNNCEVESMRAIKDAGMEPFYFRWNDDRSRLADAAGYFLPGGFSYEDRGRSGMVAARDSLMDFIGGEAETGKVVIGNCNGAQILVESGIIPLDRGLQMSLARNAVMSGGGWVSPGFLSRWVWITPSAGRDRCATSDWQGPMHLPLAHGEGRFTTKDKEVIAELRKNDQIAFSYCAAEGHISDDPIVTPNGSMYAIAGLCNPQGNVVALMPHPERTANGTPYFASLRKWVESKKTGRATKTRKTTREKRWVLATRDARDHEVFIDTIITNNEERTVEQTARKYASGLRLKQWKYFAIARDPKELLADLTVYNPHKERAFIRHGGRVSKWNPDSKCGESLSEADVARIFRGVRLLRRDEPDTGAASLGEGSETGVCYGCEGIAEVDLTPQLLEVFANPHASTLERII
ncbi:MAG: phosphoribosylformylglycinamidine synthase [Candidatus Peregrinibacteria bacterium Greene0416_19]|nr:MAG: phosphoribosylformylglycinamidine synthase [Candidatus Peregrinibacteria bacterium Greene0416_19]